jgi:hypothetical protein
MVSITNNANVEGSIFMVNIMNNANDEESINLAGQHNDQC